MPALVVQIGSELGERGMDTINFRKSLTVWLLIAIAGLVGCGFVASAEAPGQGSDMAKDVIFARKTVMSSLSDTMDKIEAMIQADKINLAEGQDEANTISVMLMAFPHLFPPSSNQWKPNSDLDPATDTFASPNVWTNYSDFYQRASAASKTAYDARGATNVDRFKAAIVELRAGCNSCHELFLKQ
jgi:cytochrome c556